MGTEVTFLCKDMFYQTPNTLVYLNSSQSVFDRAFIYAVSEPAPISNNRLATFYVLSMVKLG